MSRGEYLGEGAITINIAWFEWGRRCARTTGYQRFFFFSLYTSQLMKDVYYIPSIPVLFAEDFTFSCMVVGLEYRDMIGAHICVLFFSGL